jgi:hypothetical protein
MAIRKRLTLSCGENNGVRTEVIITNGHILGCSWDNGKARWGRETAIRKYSTLFQRNNGVRRKVIIKNGHILLMSGKK